MRISMPRKYYVPIACNILLTTVISVAVTIAVRDHQWAKTVRINQLTPKQLLEVKKSGAKVLGGVFAFESDAGCFPRTMDEVTRHVSETYFSSIPETVYGFQWEYELSEDGASFVIKVCDRPSSLANNCFAFDSQTKVWRIIVSERAPK